MVNHGKPWYNCSVTNETFVAELFLTNGVSEFVWIQTTAIGECFDVPQ